MVCQIVEKIILFAVNHKAAHAPTNFLDEFPNIKMINSAAIKIQANYRGFRARLKYKELQKKRYEDQLSEKEKNEFQAAICIQTVYRRHLAKQQYKTLRQKFEDFGEKCWSNMV